LTKAGKVRSQTPDVEKTSEKDNPGPLRKNRQNYLVRIVLNRNRRRRY
jgi:ribosomal protein S30